jgi:hypothetical protein
MMPMLQGRLAELADQATEYCKTQPRGIAGSLWEKKFAELIVRECLDIVNRKEYSYHEADPLWETAQLIKQHFGVE